MSDFKTKISQLSMENKIKPTDLFLMSSKNEGDGYMSKSINYSMLSAALQVSLPEVSPSSIGGEEHILLSKEDYFSRKAVGQIYPDKMYCISDDVEEGGGGGSVVEIYPSFLSGTNLATAIVDGNVKEIIAPDNLYVKTINEVSSDEQGNVNIDDFINNWITNNSEIFNSLIENYITNNLRTIIMNNYNMEDPEALLVLDPTKYYKSQVHMIKPMKSVIGSMDIIDPIQIKQEEYVKLMFNYSPKTKSAKNVQRIELQVYDVSTEHWSIIDIIYASDANVFHNYKRWLKCSAGTKIKFVAYAATAATTIVTNWNSFDLTTFEYSDSEFLSYVTTQITTKYKRIASQIFTVPADGKLVVNGQTDFWSNGDGAYEYNYYQAGNIYKYDLATGKKIETVNVRYIPIIDYAMNGYYKKTYDYYKGGNPISDKSLSTVMMHVVPTEVNWTNIGANTKDTTKEYRFYSSSEYNMYSQLSSTALYVNDTALYNLNWRKQYNVSLIKINQTGNTNYGQEIDTITDVAAKAQYQFREINVLRGEKYCVLYNAWSNNDADGVWNFNFCAI